MNEFLHHLALGGPLFVLIFFGYLLMRYSGWSQAMASHLASFVFNVGLPAMLFRMMGNFADLPPVDSRLLIAFFGSCFIVFAIGRLVAWRFFALDGTGQSVFAMGCIFSNNVMLGIPLTKALIGDQAIPSVALVLIFNSLILWSLVSISIEWHRHGSMSLKGLAKTTKAVLKNPIILAILSGCAIGLSGVHLPEILDTPIGMIGQIGMPLALIALGMELAAFNLHNEWKTSVALSILKLLVQPLVIWGICEAIDLPLLETEVIVLLGSIGLGVNVFLMASQFNAVREGIAGGLILSTLLSVVTTPLFLALVVQHAH